MPDFDLEQVNKVRLAMGMKPLPVPGTTTQVDGPVFKEASHGDTVVAEAPSTYDSRQAAAGDNWAKLQQEQERSIKRQAQKQAIRKAQEKAQRFAKLEGKGLADDDEVDTRAWLKTHKKSQQKLEKSRRAVEQELAERERQAEYTAKDLAGVKVGHELSQFDDGTEQILILKDAAIDAEAEDDELENLTLRDAEKLQEHLDAKRKRPVYDPNADSEEGAGILQQYDEEIHGKKRKNFTLDSSGNILRSETQDENNRDQGTKGVVYSLEAIKPDRLESDYKQAREVKVKKVKNKSAKSKKRKIMDDEDSAMVRDTAASLSQDSGTVTMQPDSRFDGVRVSTKHKFSEDDSLHGGFATQRREIIKKRKMMRPEDIAREIQHGYDTQIDTLDEANHEDEEPGLVIDETSEFIANLQKPTRRETKPRATALDAQGSAAPDDAEPDSDVEMGGSTDSKQKEDNPGAEDTAQPDTTTTGLEDEATLTKGMGATLNMLTQRGIIQTAASGDLNATHRERQRFLADKQRREAEAEVRARQQRERDRLSGKLEHMSAREREAYAQRTNVSRDQMESRQMADVFNREYRPDVQLKYVDEYGRQMNQKEAFKHLSHQFHGKGSGKQKTEKRMKKIENEKRKEAMSVLDASQNSTNMNSAMEGRAKKTRQAGVRLQ